MPIFLLIVMLAVVAVLVVGIVLMGSGSKLNEKYGNKLMVARVVLQGLAIVLVGVLMLSK